MQVKKSNYLSVGWIDNGTPTRTSPTILGDRLQGLSVEQNGVFLNIQAAGNSTIRISDAQGRLVRQVTGSGPITIDTRNMAIGAYTVSADQNGNRLTKQVMIAR